VAAPAVLTVTLLALAPGEALPAHDARGVELAAFGDGPSSVVPTPAPAPAPTAGDRLPWHLPPPGRGFDQGHAASDRRADALRNAAAHPLDVAVFAVAPAPDRDAQCAGHVSEGDEATGGRPGPGLRDGPGEHRLVDDAVTVTRAGTVTT
jgi:hypothetical protein